MISNVLVITNGKTLATKRIYFYKKKFFISKKMRLSKTPSSHLSPVILLSIAVLMQTCQDAECLNEDAILDFLEQLRLRMCHPIPQLGLPALDPFHTQYVEAEINNKYLLE